MLFQVRIVHIVDTITSDSNHDCYLLQLAVNSSGTQMRTIVSISPPERITVAAAQSSGPPTTDRMGNLEKQMGLVIETLTNMSSEMKSFQKAVSNMDVLVRSSQELQESEFWRSGMSGVNTRSSLSTPPTRRKPSSSFDLRHWHRQQYRLSAWFSQEPS